MPEVSSFSPSTVSIQAAAEVRPLTKMLYSRKDSAFVLSISIRSLDHLIAHKKLNTRKVGRKIMISHGELLRFSRADHSCLRQHPAPDHPVN